MKNDHKAMRNIRKNRKAIATALLIIVILTVTSGSYYYLRSCVIADCWRDLKDNAEAVDAQFDALVQSNEHALENISIELSAENTLKNAETALKISSARIGAMHTPVRLFLPDGFAVTEDGIINDVTETVRYEDIKHDICTMSTAKFDPFNPNVAIIEHYYPVVKNGKTVAMLCAAVQLNRLSDFVRATVYDGRADISAFDRRDRVFFYDTAHEGNFVMTHERRAERGYSAEKWYQNLCDGIEDNLAYRDSGNHSTLIYSVPSSANSNWMISLQVFRSDAFSNMNLLAVGFITLLGLEVLALGGYTAFMLHATHTDLRDFYENLRSREREQSQHSIDNLSTALTAMTESYLSLVHVDFDTGLEIRYREDERMKSVARGTDYYARLRRFAERYIIEEDRVGYIKAMQPTALLAALEIDSAAVIRCRMRDTDGVVRWYETRAVHNAGHKDHNCVLLGMRNVDAEVRAADEQRRDLYNREMMKVINGLAEDYACVLLVNPETRTSQVYRVSPETENMPGWKDLRDFDDQIDCILENTVHPDDREAFRSGTRLNVILEKLKHSPSYTCEYRRLNNGTLEHWALKCTLTDSHPLRIIAGFHNVDEEYRAAERRQQLQDEHAQQQAFISLFVDNYVSVYYINLETGAFVTYKRTARLKEKYGALSDFSASTAEYIASDVYEEDRPRMTEQLDPKIIRKRLSRENEYFVIFREQTDILRYIRMQVIRGRDADHTAIGFTDVTDEYQKEVREKAHLEKLVHERTQELETKNTMLSRMNENIIDMLGNIIENRDPESGDHVHRVKQFTRILVDQVMRELPEYGITPHQAELITNASSLHDVGKISISDTILLKPGRLTNEERAIMETHCVKGCEILRQTSGNWTEEYLCTGLDICLNHHEKWDGRGYPNGLKGDEIPISAQIVSIADIYDALTTRRCYKDAYSVQKAYQMITEGQCGQFSDKLLKCLEHVRPQFEQCAMGKAAKQ